MADCVCRHKLSLHREVRNERGKLLGTFCMAIDKKVCDCKRIRLWTNPAQETVDKLRKMWKHKLDTSDYRQQRLGKIREALKRKYNV